METLEEASENYNDDFQIKGGSKTPHIKNQHIMNHFIAGAKWQAERSYSEEDLKEAFKGGGKMSWTDIEQESQEPYYYDFKEWFEQFKKK
jgi:hypothetical protein